MNTNASFVVSQMNRAIRFTAGNVGIGTTNPATTLDVTGTARITTSLTTGAVNAANVTATNIVATAISSGTINFSNAVGSSSITVATLLATTSVSSGAFYSTNATSTNIVGTTISAGTAVATTYTGGSMSLSGNLTLAGTLTTVNITTTNISETNVSAGSVTATNTNFTTQTVGTSRITTSLLALGNSNTLGNLYTTGGNIGIGTTAPSRLLSLNGLTTNIMNGPHVWINTSDQTNPVFQMLNWSGDNVSMNFDMYYDGSFRNSSSSTAWQIYKLSSQLRFMYQNGTAGSSNGQTTALTLASTGNVGIGTFSPGYTLDVNGSARILSPLRVGNGTGAASLQLNDVSGAAWQLATGDYKLAIGNGSTGSYTTRMTLTSTGNVGIGTASPGEALDVRGNLRIGSSTQNNYISFYGLTGDGPGEWNHTYIGERLYGGGENAELLLFKGNDVSGASGPDRIRFLAANHVFDTYTSPLSGTFAGVATSGTTRMTIDQNGNIGIGTTSPSGMLHLNGSALFTSTGNLTCTGDVISFGSLSDRRLKKNIESISTEKALDVVSKLRSVTFDWQDDVFNEAKRNVHDIGFIAQEVEDIVPEAVSEYTEIESGEVYKRIKHERLVPYLLTAIQYLLDKVNN